MHRFFYLFILILLFVLPFSCNDHEDEKGIVPDEIVQNFQTRYPNAKNIDWGQEEEFFVSDFIQDDVKMKAIYDFDGNWIQTESELPSSQPVLDNDLP